jgi:hypothetical protein
MASAEHRLRVTTLDKVVFITGPTEYATFLREDWDRTSLRNVVNFRILLFYIILLGNG